MQFNIYLSLQTAAIIGQNKSRDLFQPITVVVYSKSLYSKNHPELGRLGSVIQKSSAYQFPQLRECGRLDYSWIKVMSAESCMNAFWTPIELFIPYQIFAAGQVKAIFNRQLEIFMDNIVNVILNFCWTNRIKANMEYIVPC